jgi:hypothetical protein
MASGIPSRRQQMLTRMIEQCETGFPAGLIGDGTGASGIELQKNLSGTSAREMNGHEQPSRESPFAF